MISNSDEYKSISAPSEGLFKDQGSRFIALAYPVESEAEVKALLEADFTVTDRRYLGFDSETGYHHYVIDAAKYYEWEV